MKKTSFTLKEHTHVSADGPCRIQKWLTYCLAFAFSFGLFMNQGYAQTFAMMSDCPGGSGNAINSGCPVAPAPVNAGATCMVPVPNLMPAGGFGIGDVTVGADYMFVAGAVQDPGPGTLVGPGSTDIFVGATFSHITDGLCAVACPAVALVVTDVTPPTNNCMGGLLVDVPAGGPCTVTLDDAYVRANLFNADPTDNCTALADLVITLDDNVGDPDPANAGTAVTSVGPLVCPVAPAPAVNPQDFSFRIIVTDEAGNATACDATINLRDMEGPVVDWVTPMVIELEMDAGTCEGTMPDLEPLVVGMGGVVDNCDGTPVFSQSTPVGSTVGAPLAMDADGCPIAQQLNEEVRYTDCFGQPTSAMFEIRFVDAEAPEFDNGGADVCTEAAVNLPGTPVVADDMCMITIPDLTAGINATDNCPTSTITIVQDPAAGTMVDVSGMCPPDNFIDITFTPQDCNGNMGTPVTL